MRRRPGRGEARRPAGEDRTRAPTEMGTAAVSASLDREQDRRGGRALGRRPARRRSRGRRPPARPRRSLPHPNRRRQVERRQRREDAEEERRAAPSGTRPADEPVVRAARDAMAARDGASGWDRLEPQRPDGEHDRETGERGEDDGSADAAPPRLRRPDRTARRRRRRPSRSRSPRPAARRGVAASSQAKAPAHVKPLPHALQEARRHRAASNRGRRRSRGSTRPISVRPTSTARRAPSRAAAAPPGSPPTSAPAAYAPTSTPAPAFERWRCVGEVGEERRQRRVEHRVHPDERADEEQETAHCHAA